MNKLTKKLMKEKKEFNNTQPLGFSSNEHLEDQERQKAAQARKIQRVKIALGVYRTCKKCGKEDGLQYLQTKKHEYIFCKHCETKVKIKDILGV